MSACGTSNADKTTALDYNTNFTTDDRFAPIAFRASDHDPVMVGLSLAADLVVTQPVVTAMISTNAKTSQPYAVNITEAMAAATTP